MIAISTISMMAMVVSWLSLSLSLSMISMIAISTISMMAMVVSWLSNSNRFSISLSYCFWFSLPFAIISMMAISTIAMMAISMIVSWFSDSCTKDGKRNFYQKIHALIGLNS